MDSLSQAERDVLAERRRQIDIEGWTPKHAPDSMAHAAACYALTVHDRSFRIEGHLNILWLLWPWDRKWWKPYGRRRDLVRAGALIIAEIERLDRQSIEKVTP